MKNIISNLTNAVICLCFSKFSGPNLSALAKAVIKAMTGNLLFKNSPEPGLASLRHLLTAYDEQAALAKNRDKNAIMAKKLARNNLVTSLKALGRWCMAEANGNRQMLESTGFPMGRRGAGQQVPPIDAPKNLQVKDGPLPYSIQVSVDRDTRYRGFMFQYSSDTEITPDTAWESKPSSVKNFIFYDLSPYKLYWFRVVVFGSKGQERVSNAVRRVAQ